MDQDMRGGEMSLTELSTAGMIDMRDVVHHTDLHMVACNVARYGPKAEKEFVEDSERFHFLIPDDPYHAHYLHKVAEFRTVLQARIPGIPLNMMKLPWYDIFCADLVAQIMVVNPELEKWLLAHPEDIVESNEFVKSDDVFDFLYQHRLAEHRRTQLQVRAQIPGTATADAAAPIATTFSMLSVNTD